MRAMEKLTQDIYSVFPNDHDNPNSQSKVILSYRDSLMSPLPQVMHEGTGDLTLKKIKREI